MNGLKRNVAKLFSNKGRLLALAMDHAQGGLMPGLEDPRALLRARAGSRLDGFLVNVGLADEMARPELVNKKLLLRAGFGGTMLAESFTNVHRNHVSPETALALGADAVVMMMTLGGDDFRSIQDAAAAIDGFHGLGIPVIAEILCRDFSKTATFDIQANGARVAAELGADVVKAFFTPDFRQVVARCPVPVVLAGGPKDRDILDVAREALDCGVKGFAFGRNLFQADRQDELIDCLDAILRG